MAESWEVDLWEELPATHALPWHRTAVNDTLQHPVTFQHGRLVKTVPYNTPKLLPSDTG